MYAYVVRLAGIFEDKVHAILDFGIKATTFIMPMN
jgi:hypothetical protein